MNIAIITGASSGLGVEFFKRYYARILRKRSDELTRAGIYGEDSFCSALQKTIGKAAARCSYIDSRPSDNVNIKMIKLS